MAKLLFDQTGEKFFETGVKNGVLFVQDATGVYQSGVAWNGLTAVKESPEGAEPSEKYADNEVFVTIMSKEKYKGTIEAFMYPDEFAICDGSDELATGLQIYQQSRRKFAFAYITLVGNDIVGESFSEKLNIVYGCLVSPSEKSHETINENTELSAMSWAFKATPVEVTGKKPTANATVRKDAVTEAKWNLIMDSFYGTTEGEPTLLLPDAIKAIIDAV